MRVEKYSWKCVMDTHINTRQRHEHSRLVAKVSSALRSNVFCLHRSHLQVTCAQMSCDYNAVKVVTVVGNC